MRKAIMISSAAAAAAGVGFARKTRTGRAEIRRVQRSARNWAGRSRGWMYRMAKRHPDTEVDDRTLADRIRSELGPVEKRFDIPHIHVMVENGVALLHGDVDSEEQKLAIELAVKGIAGVKGVESFLHVGLLASDNRPSAGRS